MKEASFYEVFIEYLQDLYDAEHQIVTALPKMIKEASDKELKEGFTKHLAETKEQVKRLETIFKLLNVPAKRKSCHAMKGLIEEGKEILEKAIPSSAVKDCFLIIAAQKIEHYEMAAYGSARTLVKHLKAVSEDNVDYTEMNRLLKETLDEESHANKTLTKVAEGKTYTTGVNDEIEEELRALKR